MSQEWFNANAKKVVYYNLSTDNPKIKKSVLEVFQEKKKLYEISLSILQNSYTLLNSYTYTYSYTLLCSSIYVLILYIFYLCDFGGNK